jgi:pilus assembly protein TadC
VTKSVEYRSYFPVLGVLGIVLVILKAMGYLDWSWWWVLAPFWGPWALGLSIIFVPIVVLAILTAIVSPFIWVSEWNHDRKWKKKLPRLKK